MTVRFRYIALVVMVFLQFMLVSSVSAQAAGQITGTILDPTGAIVPGATVTLKNTGTNAVRSVRSDSAGIYSFTNLQPGDYTVTSTSAGFSPFTGRVTITVGGQFTLDAHLAVVNANTSVDVSASETALVNTSTAEVSQVVTSEQVAQLPSLTRNPYDFVQLSGNVSAGDNSSPTNYQNGPTAIRGVGFNVNGGRSTGTEVLLDGVENISLFTDQVALRVPIDSVQEYRIITNNFLPEYGRASGGVVALATKSGTNAFHGTAWEFNRLSATTANTVTNAQAGAPKGEYTRNQFGVEAAGPIVKNKLFFEGTVEFLRVRSAATNIAAVPTPQLLAATPSVASFFSMYAGPSSATTISQTTNLQAGNGGAPLYASLAPSLPIFNIVSYTAPGDAGGGAPENRYNIVGRVDYSLGEKTQAFFRFTDDHEIDQSGYGFSSPYSQYNVGESTTGEAYMLSVAHEFNAALSTLTKLSFSRANLAAYTYNKALQNVPTLFVAPNAQDPYTSKPFQFPGFFDTNPANGGLPSGGPQNTIQYNQDVSDLKGRHNLQMGGQVLYLQMNQSYGAYAQASEQLGSSQSKGLQNLLTGNLYEFEVAINPQGKTPCAQDQYLPKNAAGALTYIQTPSCTITTPAVAPSFARSDRYHDWAGYGQDQWKATSRFTLDYGVRYEYFGVQHDNNPNLDANYYYGQGSSLQAKIRSGSVLTVPNSPNKTLWNPQFGTVSPRLGFAIDLFGNGKTSLRAGYGISYERNFGNVTFNVIQNPPNYAVIVLKPSNVTNSNLGTLGAASGPQPIPSSSLRHVDQNIRTAQVQFRSFSIDQQIGPRTVFEVTYNGSRGLHLYDIKNYNIPGSGNLYLGDPINDPQKRINPATGMVYQGLTSLNPNYSNDNNRGSNGDSYYDSVNFQLNASDIYHSGLSIIANYTFAHSLDDLSTSFSEDAAGNFELGYTNAFNPALDHGSSDYDVRHRFVLAPIYKMPTLLFKNKPGYLKEIAGGYELTGIYTVRTGTPFTFYDSTNNNSGYQVVRYNPASPVTQRVFKSIPANAPNKGNAYTLTGPTTLPIDVPFGNAALMGISDLGPYPSTMTGRNIFRGPGAYNLDVSISKQFPIHERLNIELRAEGFDVTNHHNLYIQQSQTDAANYSSNPQIVGSKGGIGNNGGANDERRFLQFAGKVNF